MAKRAGGVSRVDQTHITVPTCFVESDGIRFAYRRFGQESGIPVLFFQRFRGGMDHWDPAVTDGFAQHRPVVLFDNAGVAGTTGQHDVMIPTINSFTLSQGIPRAQLIIYPDSGHGVLFQFPELFVAHGRMFLESP
jgi:pimeloyl-ACP methyl ester carboxylesterase